MARPKKVVNDSDIQFFGEIDLNDQTGERRSEYPAWYFDVHIEELREGVERKQRQLDQGLILPDQVQMMKADIERENEKLKTIEKSRPRLTGEQKDRCWNAYKEVADQLATTMPTRKQTQDGLVNPHDELKRMKKTKHIEIDPAIAKSCGVKPVNGKVTGDEAVKCYKILGKVLGESTNPERLRRDGQHEAYKSIHDLTKMILEGREIRGT